jgi:hypothetical protein
VRRELILRLYQVEEVLDDSCCLPLSVMRIYEVRFSIVVAEVADPLIAVVRWRYLDQIVCDASYGLFCGLLLRCTSRDDFG